eukprot:1998497-Alexandrium_andersonii.AAC.1
MCSQLTWSSACHLSHFPTHMCHSWNLSSLLEQASVGASEEACVNWIISAAAVARARQKGRWARCVA